MKTQLIKQFLTALTGVVISSAAWSGTLTINSGAVLDGTGTLNGDLDVKSGGSVQPADASTAGCLPTSGTTQAFNSGGVFGVQIEGNTACSGYDQLQVTGGVALGSGTLNLTGSYTPANQETFTIIQNDGADAVSGTFSGYAEDSSFFFNSKKVYITYTGGDGNDVVIDYKFDWDNDGSIDSADAFVNDASETADSDGDGVGDNADAFDADPTESVDSDLDGVGDNKDYFPNDINQTVTATALIETGRIQLSDTIDNSVVGVVTLSNTFTDPVVVAYIPTRGGNQAADVRVRNVTGSGFDIFMQEPDNQSHSAEYANYMVVERGHWTLSNGVVIEAGTTVTSNAHVDGDDASGADAAVFTTPFSSAPVVIHTLNTYNNADFMSSRIDSVTTTGFNVEQEAVGSGSAVVSETIAWVAFDAGNSSINHYFFEVSSGSDGTVDGYDDATPHAISMSSFGSVEYETYPLLFVDGQTLNDTDGYWARGAGQDLAPTSHSVYAEEGDLGDGEQNHPDETFGWVAVTSGTMVWIRDWDNDGLDDAQDSDDDGDGIPDVSDTFPYDATETADNDNDGIGDNADPDDDNDGYSDSDETDNGTDPLNNASVPADNDGDFISDLNDSDDDNDGMPDTFETTYGLNPLVDDASLDGDGDLYTNLDEYLNGTDPTVFDSRVVRNDQQADGDGDIIFQESGTGSVTLWLMQDASLSSAVWLGVHGTGTVSAIADTDGDLDADIVFQKATSTVTIWTMQNGALSGSADIGFQVGYILAGSGDIDNDGDDDLVFDSGSGDFVVWIMENNTRLSSSWLGNWSGHSLMAMADIDKDGDKDIVTQDASGNVNVIELENGAKVAARWLGVWAGRTVTGVGDSDNDGDDDIFMENAGDIMVIEMENGNKVIGRWLGIWSNNNVLAIGDIDNDGDDDLILQDSGTGSVAGIEMESGAKVIGRWLGTYSYTVMGAIDADADGDIDLVLQDGSGNVALLKLQGADKDGGAVWLGNNAGEVKLFK